MKKRNLWIWCGLAGVASVASYFIAVFLPWPETQFGTSAGLLAISGFPIFGIVFAYGIHGFVGAEREGAANQLGFVFAVAAFAMVLGMIFAQQAVFGGIGEMTEGLDEVTATAMRRSLRLIDLGLDVAWDFLIGTAMILWGIAMRRRSGLGLAWGLPLVILGVALILLNAATFPWPPATRGLFDIGPFIAVFFAALGGRIAFLARRTAA